MLVQCDFCGNMFDNEQEGGVVDGDNKCDGCFELENEDDEYEIEAEEEDDDLPMDDLDDED